MDRPLRVLRVLAAFGLALFSLWVLLGGLRSLRAQWDPRAPFDNPVDRWAARLQAIPALLPAGVETVGYLADWDIPGRPYDGVDQDAEYMLTQYSLAPLRVVPGADHEWIIGNFTAPGFESFLDGILPAYEIRSLKLGIYLIHRSPPPTDTP